MPGATSPLGIDVVIRSFTAGMNQGEMKDRQNNGFMQHRYFASGLLPMLSHLTMSVVDLLTRLGDLDSVDSQGIMLGIFGRILDDPELKELVRNKEIKSETMTPMSAYKLVKSLFFCGYGIEKLKDRTFSYRNPAENGRTSVEIFDLASRACSHIIPTFKNHVINTEMSSFWNMLLFGTLGKAKGCVDNDVYCDFAKLLATSSNVESADIPSALQGLAQAILKDIKSENFKSMTTEEAQKWLETSTGQAGQKFRQFIQRHGHRCLKEFDVHSIPWSMDRKPLVKLLQNMVGTCEAAKEKEMEDFSSLLPHLAVPLDLKTRLYLRFLLPNCRRAVRLREASKSIMIKSADNLRKGFQHLSKAMVAEGYIPDADLLYFLCLDEINELLQTRNPRLISRANHRRKLYPILNEYIFPEIFKGHPTPINENQDEEIEFVADLTMKGIPVSQGVVKGYARVAVSLEEAAHLKKGEILITYGTDIGWSPYFPILAGVVTELGGLISHGAVVSREYGLPCVVGLHGATKHFTTGDYVLLDGNKGILKRLTPQEQRDEDIKPL